MYKLPSVIDRPMHSSSKIFDVIWLYYKQIMYDIIYIYLKKKQKKTCDEKLFWLNIY